MRIILNGKTVEFTDDVAKKLLGSLVRVSFDKDSTIYVGVIVGITQKGKNMWSIWVSIPDDVETVNEAIKIAIASFKEAGIEPTMFKTNADAVKYFENVYKTTDSLLWPQSYICLSETEFGNCDIRTIVRK